MMTRNVVLIVLDSVRKDFFDRFAYRIADRADVNFAHARAVSSWSVPSHASMFTGELPHEHGLHTHSRSFDLDPSRLFHTRLHLSSVAVSANAFVGSAYDFDSYFDSFADVSATQRFPHGLSPADLKADSFSRAEYLRFLLAAVRHEYPVESLKNGLSAFFETKWWRLPGPKLVDDSGRAVLRNAYTRISSVSEPWFLFVNLMDAHIPLQHFRGLDQSLHTADDTWSSAKYDVWELMCEEHPEYWETRETVYGAYIDYLDRLVTEFVQKVEQETSHETTVVVTADHGENHGESMVDGLANHKSSLAEPLLHVPLVVLNAPDDASAPDGLISLLDLPDLLTGLASGEWTDIQRDLIPAELLGMSAGPNPPDELDDQYYRRGIRVCYRNGTKYEWDSIGNAVAYEIDSNRPCWQRQVDSDPTVPRWARAQFSVPLEEAVSRAKETEAVTQVNSAIEERLRKLGYK